MWGALWRGTVLMPRGGGVGASDKQVRVCVNIGVWRVNYSCGGIMGVWCLVDAARGEGGVGAG